MFFIVRALFWIGVVLLLLPASAGPRLSLARYDLALPDTSVLTTTTATDAATYCLRHAEGCRDGFETARRFGARLDQGARLIAALAVEPAAPAATGSIPLPPPRPAAATETAR